MVKHSNRICVNRLSNIICANRFSDRTFLNGLSKIICANSSRLSNRIYLNKFFTCNVKKMYVLLVLLLLTVTTFLTTYVFSSFLSALFSEIGILIVQCHTM